MRVMKRALVDGLRFDAPEFIERTGNSKVSGSQCFLAQWLEQCLANLVVMEAELGLTAALDHA